MQTSWSHRSKFLLVPNSPPPPLRLEHPITFSRFRGGSVAGAPERHRPAEPAGGAGEAQAQEEAPRPVPQLLLHCIIAFISFCKVASLFLLVEDTTIAL